MVLVGTRRDSETYVRNKEKACKEVGIESMATKLPEDVSQEELMQVSPSPFPRKVSVTLWYAICRYHSLECTV